jgi:hypothetical protein
MDLVMLHWGGIKEWLAPAAEFSMIALFIVIGFVLKGVEK